MLLPVPVQRQGPGLGPASGGGGRGVLPHAVLFAPAAPWCSGEASRSAPPSSATASGRISTGTPRCGTTVSGHRRPDLPPPAPRPAAGDEMAPGGEGGGISEQPPPNAVGFGRGVCPGRGCKSRRASPASHSEGGAGIFQDKSLV